MHLLTARNATIWLFWLMGAGVSFAQNPYYDHGTFPATGSLGTSAGMRAELDSIEAGFAKLPTLLGNASKVIVVNGGATGLTATDAPIPSGTSFPASPSTHALFLITDDSVSGECDSAAGDETTLCRWDGVQWTPLVNAISSTPGLSAVLAVDRIDGDAISQATAFQVGSTSANAYMVTFYDSTDGIIHTCLVGGVLDDCNKRIKLLSGKKFFVANSSGTEIFTVSETGVITNALLGEEHWFDLAACQGATASHIWDTPASNAPAAACDTGTNTQKGYASFDATTDESIQMNWVLPAGFSGAIDIYLIWKAAATTGSVAWCAQLVRVADGSTSDPAFPAQATGNCVSDTTKGTTLQENHTTITGVTCTSCTARDHVYVRISRDPDSTSTRTDDMTGDAHLMKVGYGWRYVRQ